ncbi:hypothetical protein PM082_014937 [Marasmius tenuissimus]|nr:hypothetical protein PM082_014937 [Marasmius tenuissimus]
MFPLDPLPCQQAGMMNSVIRTFLLAQLIVSCRGFNFTLPSVGSIVEDRPSTFEWNANSSDFTATTTDSFVVFLIKPPVGFHCPNESVRNGLGSNSENVVEDYVFLQKPVAQNNSFSDQVVLRPRNSGVHFLCAYGNVTEPDREDEPGRSSSVRRLRPRIFEGLVFITQSSTFDVLSSEGASSVGDAKSTRNTPNLALIVGVSVGVASLLSILATSAFFVYRRRKRSLRPMHPTSIIPEDSGRPSSFLSVSVLGPQLREVERPLNDSERNLRNDVQTHRERRIVHHEDGGVRLLGSTTGTLSESGSVIHMPPTYSEANYRR